MAVDLSPSVLEWQCSEELCFSCLPVQYKQTPFDREVWNKSPNKRCSKLVGSSWVWKEFAESLWSVETSHRDWWFTEETLCLFCICLSASRRSLCLVCRCAWPLPALEKWRDWRTENKIHQRNTGKLLWEPSGKNGPEQVQLASLVVVLESCVCKR